MPGQPTSSHASSLRRRLIVLGVLLFAGAAAILAVPGLRAAAQRASSVHPLWLIGAVALELASCVSFLAIFRRFFHELPARDARRLAWIEMGSGALLPGGGVGSPVWRSSWPSRACAGLVVGETARFARSSDGIRQAEHELIRPHWRLLGALGYLGFDIAVLGLTSAAVGHPIGIPGLVLAYLVGYAANSLPVPGGIGVLEGGLVGALVLYGAPVMAATAAVLLYHAISFWIPSLGGGLAYALSGVRQS